MRLAKVALEIEAGREKRLDGVETDGVSFPTLKFFFVMPMQSLSASRSLTRRTPWIRSDDQIVKLSVAVITTVITGRNNTYRHTGDTRMHGVSNKVEEGREDAADLPTLSRNIPFPRPGFRVFSHRLRFHVNAHVTLPSPPLTFQPAGRTSRRYEER